MEIVKLCFHFSACSIDYRVTRDLWPVDCRDKKQLMGMETKTDRRVINVSVRAQQIEIPLILYL